MRQVPFEVWNRIAREQPLSPWWREVMETPEGEENAAVAKVDALAEAVTKDNSVILAHRLTAPLMCEAEAISSFLAESQQQSLRSALPELTSMAEAIHLASEEYRLSPAQQALLRQALSRTARLTSARPPRNRPSGSP